MKIEKFDIEGLLVIYPDVFKDDRGYFFESFNQKKYEELGVSLSFVQDNLSRSKRGTIRGLHYQVGEFAQGKLCSVVSGVVLDVAVDIRFGSPTFGHHETQILSEENNKQFWIPPGFAHGFAVLSKEAVFSYKCTNFYSKNHERAILYNDDDLKINWDVRDAIVSEKDLEAKPFKEIEQDFKFILEKK
ncbi:MAG: dTDP-4-dehydrorhamnose 3,5-epimerase [Melioribacteraceae bacterium]|nr:dTDP-4-dehydrorhamnose 3,5-epimerase [Melioribacteraceae bacterium]MCF8264535.1 dTDP-4-dehydrorhamnose 3,5-epimerase [Melioribacteraceae bacterium]